MAEFDIVDLTPSPDPSRRTGEVQELALQDQLLIRGSQLNQRADELAQMAIDLGRRERELARHEQDLAAREKAVSDQAEQSAQAADVAVRRGEAARLREGALYAAEQDLAARQAALLDAVHAARRAGYEDQVQAELQASGARGAGWSPELIFAVQCRIAITAHPQVLAQAMQRQLRSLDLVHPDVKVRQVLPGG